jgi:hypothetical protein
VAGRRPGVLPHLQNLSTPHARAHATVARPPNQEPVMPDTLESAFAAMQAQCAEILAMCADIQRSLTAQQAALRRIQAQLKAHAPAVH